MTGEDVRELRKQMGLTQAELAHKMDVDSITISRWERGETKPHRASVKKLMRLKEKVRRNR